MTGNEFIQRAVSFGYAATLALQAWIAIVLTGLATWLTMKDRGRRVPTSLYPVLAGLAVVVGLIVVSSSGSLVSQHRCGRSCRGRPEEARHQMARH